MKVILWNKWCNGGGEVMAFKLISEVILISIENW